MLSVPALLNASLRPARRGRGEASDHESFANSITPTLAIEAQRRVENGPVDLDDEFFKELASDSEIEL